MKPACPSEKQLKSLIMEAFDELSAPDPARMQRIATTLSRQTSKRTKPQLSWLFWVLLGGSVSAVAWWANDGFMANNTPPPQKHESGQTSPTAKQKIIVQPAPRATQQKPNQSQQRFQSSPIIDQRERY